MITVHEHSCSLTVSSSYCEVRAAPIMKEGVTTVVGCGGVDNVARSTYYHIMIRREHMIGMI